MSADIVFFALFVVVAVGLVAQVGIPLWHAARSHHWMTTSGRVLEARVIGIATQTPLLPGPELPSRAAAPLVRYEYTVDGARYEGTLVSYAGFGYKAAIGAAVRYEVGQMVTVWYHPDRPGRAVLEPGVTVDGALGAIGACGLLAVALLLVLAAW